MLYRNRDKFLTRHGNPLGGWCLIEMDVRTRISSLPWRTIFSQSVLLLIALSAASAMDFSSLKRSNLQRRKWHLLASTLLHLYIYTER